MKKMIEAFTVKLKELKDLKKFARHFGGDMSESMAYVIRHDNGELVDRNANLNDIGSFTHTVKHVLENGQEFLVVDHPNVISKADYERTKALYEEVNEDNYSMKGVC